MKMIMEPQQSIPVHLETDVLVVGGGPAGAAAAISAARMGVRVTLMERYGFLGGLATGGHVLMIPNLNNGAGLAMGGILLEAEDVKGLVTHALCPAEGLLRILGRKLGAVDNIYNKFVFHKICSK